MVDRWMSHIWTRGILVGECNGATWPSHGLPRGTPPLVGCMGKIVWTP
jgi:hypothetical protein